MSEFKAIEYLNNIGGRNTSVPAAGAAAPVNDFANLTNEQLEIIIENARQNQDAGRINAYANSGMGAKAAPVQTAQASPLASLMSMATSGIQRKDERQTLPYGGNEYVNSLMM